MRDARTRAPVGDVHGSDIGPALQVLAFRPGESTRASVESLKTIL